MVNVFALSSTDEIRPLKGVARILPPTAADASALEAAELSASGDGEPFALGSLGAGRHIATTPKNAAIIRRFFSFMRLYSCPVIVLIKLVAYEALSRLNNS